MTITLETAATVSTASNDALAEAFAEIAGLITSHAHLPAVSHGSFTMHGARPGIDLWFEQPEHVAVWAAALGVQARESDSVHETETPFTVTEAAIPGRYSAELKLTHLRYREVPVSV